jgi:hypothetical protein
MTGTLPSLLGQIPFPFLPHNSPTVDFMSIRDSLSHVSWQQKKFLNFNLFSQRTVKQNKIK